MTLRKIQTIANLFEAVVTSQTPLLANDFLIPEGNRIKVSITLADPQTPLYKLHDVIDTGIYSDLNGGIPQLAEATHTYTIPVVAGRYFNMKVKEAGIVNIVSLILELYLEH